LGVQALLYNNLFEKIRLIYEESPKQQKLIASELLNNFEQSVLLNAKELSERIGVSSATVIGFAQNLGYDGYPALARDLRKLYFQENSPMVKLMESFEGPSDRFKTFQQVLELDQENIRLLGKKTTGTSMNEAVEILLSSGQVVISGARTSYSLVHYSGFLFRQLDNKFDFLNSSSDDAIDRLGLLGENDCLFAITFHRYAKRTQDLVKYCSKRKVKVVSLTDTSQSPVIPYSKVSLLAKNNAPFYSYVPAMVILNSLIAAYAKELKKSAKDIFEKKTKDLLDNDVYV